MERRETGEAGRHKMWVIQLRKWKPLKKEEGETLGVLCMGEGEGRSGLGPQTTRTHYNALLDCVFRKFVSVFMLG